MVPRVKHDPVSTVADALSAGLECWMTPLTPAVDFDGSHLHLNLGPEHPPFNGVLLAHLRNEMLHVFVVEVSSPPCQNLMLDVLILNCSIVSKKFKNPLPPPAPTLRQSTLKRASFVTQCWP